jgi:hypothetical protein
MQPAAATVCCFWSGLQDRGVGGGGGCARTGDLPFHVRYRGRGERTRTYLDGLKAYLDETTSHFY